MISVVIPTCDRPDDLRECVKSIETYNDDTNVLIIDNGSCDLCGIISDPTGEEIIHMGRNRGNAAARNIGLSNAIWPIVFFIDDDTYVPPWMCDRIWDMFAADPKLGLIACRILGAEDEGKAAPLPDPVGREVEAATGCGMAVRRELCDGFSEDGLLASAWEWELVAQVRDKGYTVKAFDDIYVFHGFSQAGAGKYRMSRQKKAESVRVPMLFWARYGPWQQVLWHGWRWSHAVAQALLEQRDLLYLTGYLSTLYHLPRAWRERRPVKPEVAARLRPTLRFKGK
jgi:glycosyltransferase involved in cell wall biosynthesis